MTSSSFTARKNVLSWGRVQRQPQHVAVPRFREELVHLVADDNWNSRLAIGLRRSYGNSCLNSEGALIDFCGLDRFICFDSQSGILRAEAGATLSQVLAFAVPRGWFLPTTPGTRFVTLGGAVANDVHGKNHHRAGTFGCHVKAFGLLRSGGDRRLVSPATDPGLFAATIGGLGLTGVIEWVEIQLAQISSSYLEVETLPFDNVEAFWALIDESVEKYEHTVAWIDCVSRGEKFGRGIFSRAIWSSDGVYHTHRDRTWKRIPIDAPSFVLNRFTVAAFNTLYYKANRAKAGLSRQHYAHVFYPLDAVLNWNRLYGRRGMFQYQCVIPRGVDRDVLVKLLDEVTRSGQASFLVVLKTFGDRASPGLLSFPRPGTTLALDIPNRGLETLALMGRLDAIVSEVGGGLYPAKDGRMTSQLFQQSFPRWQEFVKQKDPGMNSDFWRRVVA